MELESAHTEDPRTKIDNSQGLPVKTSASSCTETRSQFHRKSTGRTDGRTDRRCKPIMHSFNVLSAKNAYCCPYDQTAIWSVVTRYHNHGHNRITCCSIALGSGWCYKACEKLVDANTYRFMRRRQQPYDNGHIARWCFNDFVCKRRSTLPFKLVCFLSVLRQNMN
jgi:hypothetical protein